MKRLWGIVVFTSILLWGVPAFAGDSLYGKITEVKSAELVVLDYGEGEYDVRLIGIDAPKTGPLAEEARKLVADLVLGKNARIRFEGRGAREEMVSRLLADDPVLGVKDVGVELVKAGLAQRQKDFDYKYGELTTAENEARTAKRGLWSSK